MISKENSEKVIELTNDTTWSKILDKVFNIINVDDVSKNLFWSTKVKDSRCKFEDTYIEPLADNEDSKEYHNMLLDFLGAVIAERRQAFKIGFTVAMIIADKVDE